jgi:hypothetical protein
MLNNLGQMHLSSHTYKQRVVSKLFQLLYRQRLMVDQFTVLVLSLLVVSARKSLRKKGKLKAYRDRPL